MNTTRTVSLTGIDACLDDLRRTFSTFPSMVVQTTQEYLQEEMERSLMPAIDKLSARQNEANRTAFALPILTILVSICLVFVILRFLGQYYV